MYEHPAFPEYAQVDVIPFDFARRMKFRVLTLAYRDWEPKAAYSKEDERDLILRGYLAFLDSERGHQIRWGNRYQSYLGRHPKQYCCS